MNYESVLGAGGGPTRTGSPSMTPSPVNVSDTSTTIETSSDSDDDSIIDGVQKPGSCTGHIGSTSSGKTTSICHQLAVNHATWRYDHIWLLHPDSSAALAGEYGLCMTNGSKGLETVFGR